MNQNSNPNNGSQVDTNRLIRDIDLFEEAIQSWEPSQQAIVKNLKKDLGDLNREAFSRFIGSLKKNPEVLPFLREAVKDPVVYAVLREYGILKPSLGERIELALDSVRPLLRSHDGDVELVKVDPPSSVTVRLVGMCQGCPASSITLEEGIRKAIFEHCPEITEVLKASGSDKINPLEGKDFGFISPFAHPESEWHFATQLGEVPDDGVKVMDLCDHSIILTRFGDRVNCFENACAHLGWGLEDGEVKDGVVTCPYHGFRYILSSGECLTAPEVQLIAHAVRVLGDRVEVQFS